MSDTDSVSTTVSQYNNSLFGSLADDKFSLDFHKDKTRLPDGEYWCRLSPDAEHAEEFNIVRGQVCHCVLPSRDENNEFIYMRWTLDAPEKVRVIPLPEDDEEPVERLLENICEGLSADMVHPFNCMLMQVALAQAGVGEGDYVVNPYASNWVSMERLPNFAIKCVCVGGKTVMWEPERFAFGLICRKYTSDLYGVPMSDRWTDEAFCKWMKGQEARSVEYP